MTRQLVYACLCIFMIALQASAITSLPEPLRYFPLTLVTGVIILHERSLLTGAVWIFLAGLILEAWGLGVGLTFASLLAAIAAAVLAVFVFAKRSFWALMGVGTGTVVTYVIGRWVWLVGSAALSPKIVNPSHVLTEGLTTIVLAILGTFVFGAYARRFVRWFRDKFMRRLPDYDVA